MSPFDLIIWAICILVAGSILSGLGIQNWVARNILKRPGKEDLEKKVSELEQRVQELEKTASSKAV